MKTNPPSFSHGTPLALASFCARLSESLMVSRTASEQPQEDHQANEDEQAAGRSPQRKDDDVSLHTFLYDWTGKRVRSKGQCPSHPQREP